MSAVIEQCFSTSVVVNTTFIMLSLDFILRQSVLFLITSQVTYRGL